MKTVDLILSLVREMTDQEIDGDTIFKDLELDSLDAIDLCFEIERKTGVEIEVTKLEDLAPKTLAELALYVDQLKIQAA